MNQQPPLYLPLQKGGEQRRKARMKKIVLILIGTAMLMMTSCADVCYSQNWKPLSIQVTSEKKITTTPDTLAVSGDYAVVQLTITNESSGSDTLLFRTNNDTTWRTVYKGEHWQLIEYAKYVYRKAKSGTGFISRLWAN